MSYVLVNRNGTTLHFENRKLHRLDGPAVIYADDSEEWWYEGRRHRGDIGCAIDFEDDDNVQYSYAEIRNGKVNMERLDRHGQTYLEPHGEKFIPIFTKIVDELKALDITNTRIRENFADFSERDTVKFYWRGIQHSKTPSEIKVSGTKVYYMCGLKHRDNGPAVEDKMRNSKYWYQYGMLHREDGPARVMPSSHQTNRKCLSWFRYGVTHRLEGPAHLEWHYTLKKYVYKAWYKTGKFHRNVADGQGDGPALEITYMDYMNEIEEETCRVWFEEGKCSRLTGPAIEGVFRKWYVNDVEYEEEEYNKFFKRVEKAKYKFRKTIRKKIKEAIYEATQDIPVAKMAVCKNVASIISSFL